MFMQILSDWFKAQAEGGKYKRRVPYTDPKTGRRRYKYFYDEPKAGSKAESKAAEADAPSKELADLRAKEKKLGARLDALQSMLQTARGPTEERIIGRELNKVNREFNKTLERLELAEANEAGASALAGAEKRPTYRMKPQTKKDILRAIKAHNPIATKIAKTRVVGRGKDRDSRGEHAYIVKVDYNTESEIGESSDYTYAVILDKSGSHELLDIYDSKEDAQATTRRTPPESTGAEAKSRRKSPPEKFRIGPKPIRDPITDGPMVEPKSTPEMRRKRSRALPRIGPKPIRLTRDD